MVLWGKAGEGWSRSVGAKKEKERLVQDWPNNWDQIIQGLVVSE
jgi:hypothetical protein